MYNIAFLRFLGPNLQGPNLPYRIYRDRINLAPIRMYEQRNDAALCFEMV